MDEVRIVVDRGVEKLGVVGVDGLTELHNYRAFYELLEAEMARSERYLRPLSLLMVGLDDLKVHKDTFGHPAGDAILKEVAGLFQKCVRNSDIVARYGGDEFAIILTETNMEDAIGIANRLTLLVEETSFDHDEVLPHETLTISVGVASYPTDASEKTELVAKADQALYEAKTQGGNLVKGARAQGVGVCARYSGYSSKDHR